MMELLAGSLLWATALLTAASGASLVLGLGLAYSMMEEEDRSYMDPIPLLLRPLWPFIRLIAFYVCSWALPYELLESTETRLQRTGVSYLLTAEEFIALRLLAALIVPVLVLYVDVALPVEPHPLVYIFAPFAGFFFPTVWLNDARRRRETAVITAMPVYLDFITMAVEAGLNLQGALAQAMEKAPPGPLRNEFGIVLRDLRAGLTRSDALRRMAERLDITEVTSFVSSMIQAERMGSSLAAVLRVQADQRRNERFQRAEKMAMEAPIKLVFPLIAFIFPVTFIILGFPIVMKFMAEGTL
jgi:tight adherence protein C